MRSYINGIAIVLLAVSFVICGILLYKGLEKLAYNQPMVPHSLTLYSNDSGDDHTRLLDAEQLAFYLGIEVTEAIKLGPNRMQESVIPFIQIGDKVYFSRSVVDEWLLNNDNLFID